MKQLIKQLGYSYYIYGLVERNGSQVHLAVMLEYFMPHTASQNMYKYIPPMCPV